MPGQRVVYLHVGGHKTGTTFLQNVLWRNRAELRRDGLLFPGERKGAHIWASHDLRHVLPNSERAIDVHGAWGRLVEEIAAWDGPALIDQELFSLAAPHHIEQAQADLGFAELHVIFTARDVARQLPAVWQEQVKNGGAQTYGRFLEEVRERTPDSERFWGLHDVPGILAKWSAGIPAHRVHLITVPPPGAAPDVLWQRFAATLHLDPARYRTDDVGTNRSLGAAEAAALRLLNAALGERSVPRDAYDRLVKFRLALQLSKRRGERIALPPDAFEWAVGFAHEEAQQLGAAGYDVVGDLAELLPASRPSGTDPDHMPADQITDAVLAGLAAALRDLAREGTSASGRESASADAGTGRR